MTTKTEVATFAGGCFWCTEAIFKRLKGVLSVIPGYTGGREANPTYEQVVEGGTSHAEAIQITFDPAIISFERLLEVFWATHDPTTLNQQGYDRGTQYRSLILYHTNEQKEAALDSKKKLERDRVYEKPIVTEIIPFTHFYTAEEYHQNFYDTNPQAPYCSIIIDPKIKKLLKEFGDDVKPEYH